MVGWHFPYLGWHDFTVSESTCALGPPNNYLPHAVHVSGAFTRWKFRVEHARKGYLPFV